MSKKFTTTFLLRPVNFFHFFNTHYSIFVWSIFYAASCICIRNLWYRNQFTILCNLCFNIQSSNQELLINSFDNYYKTILNNLNLRSCVLFQIYPEPLSFPKQKKNLLIFNTLHLCHNQTFLLAELCHCLPISLKSYSRICLNWAVWNYFKICKVLNYYWSSLSGTYNFNMKGTIENVLSNIMIELDGLISK